MNILKNCPACHSANWNHFLKSKDYFLSQEEFNIVKCSDCGLKFTNPRPKDSDLGEYYKSEAYISHSNTKKGVVPILYQWVRNYTLGSKEKLLSSYVSRGTLLDYGCGSGHFLAHCQSKGWKVSGVEPDNGAREIARNQVNNVFKSRDELLAGSTNTQYSAISLWHVLEHLPDMEAVIEFLSNSLKRDGALFLALPNPLSFDAGHYKEHWAAYDLPRHLYHFDKDSLTKLFLKRGFVLVAVKPMYFDSFYVSMLSEKYLKGKTRYGHAIYNGLKSNLKAMRSGQYSSLIYVFRRAK